MDKYEYRLKAEQIDKLVKKKDYVTAAKIADTIDWRRVRNLNMLYVVSEIYEKTDRYGECMEILDIAYDRAPVGRMLLYLMTEVCTKTSDTSGFCFDLDSSCSIRHGCILVQDPTGRDVHLSEDLVRAGEDRRHPLFRLQFGPDGQ